MSASLVAYLFSPSDNIDTGNAGSDGFTEPDEPNNTHSSDRFLNIHDSEIVRRIAAGDVDLFTTLFNAYVAPLSRWAYLITGDRDMAEDVVAEIFARIWQNRDKWSVRRSVEAYLFGYVRGRIRDVRKLEERRSNILELEIGPNTLEAEEIPGLGIHGAFRKDLVTDMNTDADPRQKLVIAALKHLTRRQREAIFARWYQGMTYDQIGSVFGISALAARQLVFRAMNVLRKHISSQP